MTHRLSLTGSSGAPPPPRTRSKAATGTTTGGRSSTRPGTRLRRAVGRRVRPLLPLPRRHRACSRDLGFGAYRFSIEWSRIEPEEGEFSTRRARPLPAHDRDAAATTTCCPSSRSTTSRRRAGRRRDGGWADPTIVDRFARFCEKATAHLGDAIGMGCTINEPNVVSLIGYISAAFPPGINDFAAYDRVNENIERRAPEALRRDQGRPRRLPARAHASR